MSESAFGKAAEKMVIDVWSDIMCPFCYIGDTVLEQAIESFEHRDQLEVRYHSYQLMPELGTEPADLNKILGDRYSPEQRDAQNQHIQAKGSELGIEYNFDRAITVNTHTAHRVSHYASEMGKGQEFMRLLFKAYFTDGKNVADAETLAGLAAEVGLDRDKALEVAAGEAYSENVKADIEQARQIGFGGVPFFMFNSTYGVSGAQPLDVFTKTLNKAWSER